MTRNRETNLTSAGLLQCHMRIERAEWASLFILILFLSISPADGRELSFLLFLLLGKLERGGEEIGKGECIWECGTPDASTH